MANMSPPMPALCGSIDAEHRRGCDRGVDGVAAVLQHVEAGLRGQRLARGDDAVAGEHLGAGLLRPLPQPVAAHGGDVLPGSVTSAVGVPNGVGETPPLPASEVPAAIAASTTTASARARRGATISSHFSAALLPQCPIVSGGARCAAGC